MDRDKLIKSMTARLAEIRASVEYHKEKLDQLDIDLEMYERELEKMINGGDYGL
jgi:hypothetical protein